MHQSHRIEGSVALVSGANRGIGLAIARALLDRDAAKVYAAAREPQTLKALREQYGNRVVPLRLDVTDGHQVAAAARAAMDIDLLVNNAGAFQPTDLLDEHIVEVARREMEVNYFGVLRMVRAFAGTLARNGGAVVNVGSVAGLSNVPLQPTYSASKAAQHSLTQAARAVLTGRGVRVHGAYPGPVDTDMTKDLPPQFEKTPPEAVAKAVLDALEAGEDDIFPDAFAAALGEQFHASPKAVERQFAAMVAAPA
ncbi:SDR family oxidoreductase [Dactylosporangium matsuzakiense]|uniref:Short-chain dehydrogenase n=1 Tax=Dactylosporangium matsuzakiense TaxID=53360 RepID=A0A9W6NJH2_9ACTN|nr:SDR family oxidoreductase [Dactylosporangium matsuzakiense]GLK99248.1 short-chain dehydrogenase [Dactylosporangium matsuzakiense]